MMENVNNEERKVTTTKNAAFTAAQTLINDTLARLNNAGLNVKGAKGGEGNDIYVSDIFKDTLPEQRKKIRLKIRKMRDYHALLVLQEKGSDKACKLFLDFYKSFYRVNDFSLSSICTGRTDANTQKVLQKVLDIVKAKVQK